ncbi:hypothetical protein Cni_G25750 [Canna indica]|uniref:Syntaxin 6/10/61 N-terminal domain-containing protein n=1 Tax=Canna indica TaxID=4628 RepID=A0AAQ3KXP9_9LILI|nr:hypothetical protein Cni_G25750 [Canna indica]
MGTTFDRWKKDPFFVAAEEVQDSSDRLESVYRQWMKQREDTSKLAGGNEFDPGELRRELHTALGTAKWQLEELDKAVRSNDEGSSAGEDTRVRHNEFVSAIGSKISTMESSLRETHPEARERTHSWVRLDEGERDELAKFLSYPSSGQGKEIPLSSAIHHRAGNDLIRMKGESLMSNSKRDLKANGHRRSASCAGEIGTCTIAIPSEGEDTSEKSSDDRSNLPPQRVLSVSALTGSVDSTSKMRWYQNGFRKWTAQNQDDEIESIPLRNHEQSQGTNSCYERSKSCLSKYGQDTYNKHLYGYLGAFRRLLQRSQYQIQYGHHIKYILSAIPFVLLVVVVVLLARK